MHGKQTARIAHTATTFIVLEQGVFLSSVVAANTKKEAVLRPMMVVQTSFPRIKNGDAIKVSPFLLSFVFFPKHAVLIDYALLCLLWLPYFNFSVPKVFNLATYLFRSEYFVYGSQRPEIVFLCATQRIWELYLNDVFFVVFHCCLLLC